MASILEVDSLIQANNYASFMNDAKWEKLFENLLQEFDSILIRYKLVGRMEVKERIYDSVDFKPFFMEPIFYKEIEWIEFPEEMQIILNKRVSRQHISELKQDIERIEKNINKTGVFELEKEKGTLRLYGYK